MANCLLCSKIIAHDLTIAEFFYGQSLTAKFICGNCRANFIKIAPPFCGQCGRPLASSGLKKLTASVNGKQALCLDCQRWQGEAQWFFHNQAITLYNQHFRQWLILLKGKGELRLASAFANELWAFKKKYPAACWVPIPSSPLNYQQRGFHQTEAILTVSDIPYQNILSAQAMGSVSKQALKSRWQRMNRMNPFYINKQPLFKLPEKVILFDDVYTTGTTMKQADEILRSAGVKEVIGITLAR